MNFHPLPDLSVLKEATAAQLEQAAAANHRELFYQNAIAQGGEVKINDGLCWTYAGAGKGAMIAFPSLEENNAAAQLDEMMEYYRAHPPKDLGCWSLDPPQPADIGIMLLARGFQPGWKPCWMALDLEAIKADHPAPDGLQVYADNDTPVHNIIYLPYAGDDGAVSQALMKAQPNRTQRFIATLNGEVVAHSCVFLTTGEYGTAGLYNVGVVPWARQKGIGKAIVLAACMYARKQGYHYAVLNGTGRRMYEQLGFQWISYGITWWLQKNYFLTNPPTP